MGKTCRVVYCDLGLRRRSLRLYRRAVEAGTVEAQPSCAGCGREITDKTGSVIHFQKTRDFRTAVRYCASCAPLFRDWRERFRKLPLPYRSILAVKLRQARKRRGLTQEDLAAQAGVSAWTVNQIETDATRKPRDDTVEALAKALGLPVEKLRGD